MVLAPVMPTDTRPLPAEMRPRVLFIDDSHLIRSLALKMFGDEIDLVLAEDGQMGWDMIVADESIQLVFTDLVMPRLDGFEVLSLVRTSTSERIRQLPVIIVTGADNTRTAKEKAYQLGATDFIDKPFDATEIKARAQSHVRYLNDAKSLTQKAVLDPLTGLLNKRGMLNQLEKDISFSSRHKHQLAVLHIEIDAFKELFVRIGRNRTELIIGKIAQVILDTVRKEDSVARIGLSGFSVSLPAADPDGALLIAHRIGQTVGNLNARVKRRTLPISVSTGACIVDRGAYADAALILKISEDEKERAMTQGLNQVHSIDLSTFRKNARRESQTAISIDDVLMALDGGDNEEILSQMDFILEELEPIFKLMNDEQKERISS